MSFVRAFGLVVVGIIVGAGLVLTGARLSAGSTPPQTPARLEVSGAIWAGDFPMRFVRDAATNSCYLAGLSPTAQSDTHNPKYTITALTQADQVACSVK